jgi:hypothetical protein
VAGGQPAVGRATEVVLRDERRVRGVPQQVEEDEMAPTACPSRSGLGGSVVSMRWHSDEGGAMSVAWRAAPNGGVAPGPTHKEERQSG